MTTTIEMMRTIIPRGATKRKPASRVAGIFHGMGIEPKHVAIFWREAQKVAAKKVTTIKKRTRKVA